METAAKIHRIRLSAARDISLQLGKSRSTRKILEAASDTHARHTRGAKRSLVARSHFEKHRCKCRWSCCSACLELALNHVDKSGRKEGHDECS